jgi:hypothetical protein
MLPKCAEVYLLDRLGRQSSLPFQSSAILLAAGQRQSQAKGKVQRQSKAKGKRQSAKGKRQKGSCRTCGAALPMAEAMGRGQTGLSVPLCFGLEYHHA